MNTTIENSSTQNNSNDKPQPLRDNPGLAPFELSNYRGISNDNYYELLPVMRRYLKRVIPGEDFEPVDKHLGEWGELLGGKLNDLTIAAHQEGRYGSLEKYDRHGARIDDIVYNAEQNEIRQLSHAHGVVNLDYHEEWNRPFHFEHREALAYLSNLNGEAGINCPLAMTEGLIRILNEVGTEEQKKKFLPMICSRELNFPFAAGQYLTERVGGSHVAANRTVARRGEDGNWYLTGEKWFCSNPGEVWLTTARIENSSLIGCFIVSRYKEDGALNDHHILRLKDIIGSRGKVTAEVEYRDTRAELIGRPHTGLALLVKHVINVSRVHTGFGACAIARRAFWEARAYARHREAFGKTIQDYPSIQRSLGQMQAMVTAMELAIFDNWGRRRLNEPVFDLYTPLLKYICTSNSSDITHEAIMIHGGNGILGDYSVLPRLHNDAIINETWEGTHNIIANHVVKAFRRPKIKRAFDELMVSRLERIAAHSELSELHSGLGEIQEQLNEIDPATLSEGNRQGFCDRLFAYQGLSLLASEAVLDLEAGKNESVYKDLSQVFLAMTRYGNRGLLPSNSALWDEALMGRVINY